MGDDATPPLKIFISYAHEDEALCGELIKHLSQLQHDGVIESWHDRRITAGSEWVGEIDCHFEVADIVLLLVSPDFLASRYCYDVEMRRALERHRAGEARVIPVICRASDWQTSPFATLQALPRNARPVARWKFRDDAFLDVARGLRRVAEELRGTGQACTLPAPRLWKIRASHVVLAAALVVVAGAAGWWWRARQQRAVEERRHVELGNALLDVGRYAEARAPYEQALALNHGNAQARLGLKKVALAELRSKPVDFEVLLGQLLKETKADAHLKVLEGDYLYSVHQSDKAMSLYREASRMNPRLAEAFFRLGVLYDQRNDSKRAVEMYERAVQLSPLSPHYLNNLGDQYFRRGQYREALASYADIRTPFPLAALESARIHRLLRQLAVARDKQLLAIHWLENPAVASLPENQWPWYFKLSGTGGVKLAARNEKLCYAQLALSATLDLRGDGAGAVQEIGRAAATCGPRLEDVKAVVSWELERVADEVPELAARAAASRRRLLAE